MKITIKINADVDGEWRDDDKDALLNQIDQFVPSVFIIDNDRCAVIVNSWTTEVKE